MSKTKRVIKPDELGKMIDDGLIEYSEELVDRVNEAGSSAMDELVKLTKASAPVGARGDFRRDITSRESAAMYGHTKWQRKSKYSKFTLSVKKFIWCVKAPNYRLTHLLVHGHATPDGGRTKANPFLQNALDQVLPEYEKAIKNAIEEAGKR